MVSAELAPELAPRNSPNYGLLDMNHELKQRHRRWEFGLFAILVLVALVAVAISLFVFRSRVQEMERSVQAIRDRGGFVRYDYELDSSGENVADAQPPGPRWVRKLLGEHCFADVVYVRCSSGTDAELKAIGRLSHLQEAHLQGVHLLDSETTDAGLAHLKSLSRLNFLDLSRTRITDAGLEHLRELTQLQHLILTSTEITDTGLERLKTLTQLRTLDIAYTHVTDAGLKHIEDFKHIVTLGLNGIITDAGLKSIEGLTELEILYLGDTAITDNGLKHIGYNDTIKPP